ncbi:unnamed protein product [Ectocarpus fasciculatus]
MKFLKKQKRILSVLFLIKNLDLGFFELFIDSIKDSKKNQINKNKGITLFTIYLNLFSTKKLKIQHSERKLDPKMINTNLVYSLLKQPTNKESKFLLRKTFFYNIYLNRFNELLTSQIIDSTQIIERLDRV